MPIRLASDFDQLREKWVKKPMEYLTSVALSTRRATRWCSPPAAGSSWRPRPRGGWCGSRASRACATATCVFLPDGKRLLGLSDATGELEFATLPANGVGEPVALTSDGKVLRFEGVPSPDGQWVAYTDNNNDLWLLNVATKAQTLLVAEPPGRFRRRLVARQPLPRLVAGGAPTASTRSCSTPSRRRPARR